MKNAAGLHRQRYTLGGGSEVSAGGGSGGLKPAPRGWAFSFSQVPDDVHALMQDTNDIEQSGVGATEEQDV